MAAEAHAWFVAGTDAEMGKTLVAGALTHACATHGLQVAAVKPIAAGAVLCNGEVHTDDVAEPASVDSAGLPCAWTTPCLLREPAAPHIAAALEGVQISRMHLLDCYHRVTEAADAVVVEGVGGFRVPLSDSFDTADLAQMLSLPVVLVVGMRLGCINHALLTAEAIAARGLTLAGWVANEPRLTQRTVDPSSQGGRYLSWRS